MKNPSTFGTDRWKALGARYRPLQGSAAVKSRMAQCLRVLLANIARTATISEAAMLQKTMVVTVEAASDDVSQTLIDKPTVLPCGLSQPRSKSSFSSNVKNAEATTANNAA